jgi:S-adenosylhomocysteine hydrolase
MKIYLAGPMRGYDQYNFSAFDNAAALLRAEGHKVFNPAERDRKTYGNDIQFVSKKQAQKRGLNIRKVLAGDLAWICKHAECVALLPGWKHSRGANAERMTGLAIGAAIRYLGKAYIL